MKSVPISNRFGHTLRDSLLQSLGSTAHVPTITVAQVLVNNIAFVRSRQYIIRGCREKLSGGKDNSRFDSKVTTFNGCFDLRFERRRNVSKPR